METTVETRSGSGRFPALSVPHFRVYAAASLLAMAADNVEHVIGYWLIWEITRSPFWLGYAVVTHWLPFTLFSIHAGSLADRSDCRRLIQISQALYIAASLGWGTLYLTGYLQIWQIAFFLVFHGLAGLIAGPSSMLIIHEMVGEDKLVSAISLNASLRPLATVLGPAIGGLLMATVGPGWGFFVNILIYLPLSVVVMFLPYRGAGADRRRRAEPGWSYVLEGLKVIRRNRTITALLIAIAAASFLLGNAFQALVPAFATQLGASSTGYSMLLSANGVGAIIGGVILGWIGTARLRPVIVTGGILIWSVLLSLFSQSHNYLLSLTILCLVGVFQIVFVSMSQSIVQSWAPHDVRGRVIGVYNLAANGTRVLSGVVVGTLATALGPAPALLLMATGIGLAVVGVSAASRGLWRSELQEEALPAEETRPAAARS